VTAAPAAAGRWRTVDPSRIERALAELWLDAAQDGPLSRAVMSNLVVVRPNASLGPDAQEDPDSDIVRIAQQHPARTILLAYTQSGRAARPAHASIGVVTFGAGGTRYGVEIIEVEAACTDRSVPSIVRRLARGDVPTTSRVLINGEPTESTLATGTKGAMRFSIRTSGEAAHSAYPHLGKSAIVLLVNLLAEMQTLELPADEQLGATTINIGTISGGVADNVVAPSAEARLMMRLVTPVEVVKPIFERWAADRATIEWSIMVPPVRLGVLDGFPTSVAAFATDIPELTEWGTPYLFGPGSIHVAHRDDEFVDLAELAAAADTYERLARQLL